MKVLIIGGGGREHAIAWKIAKSPKVEKIFCAPGNPGIADYAKCLNIDVNDITSLLTFAYEEQIDLTIVGPEAPLVAGIVDVFQSHDLRIFGPSKIAAQLEGSKQFAKEIMKRYDIPTARYALFREAKAAKDYVRKHGVPCVIKADGLAAGKGVVVATTEQDALTAIVTIMEDKAFGDAGEQVVIEEYLEGEEVSVLAFTDGKTIIPMVSSQDHKRIFEGDEGPNTGGMGAYSPAPVYTPEIRKVTEEQVLGPITRWMTEEKISYQGIIYAGLMITKDGPKVLEFNCRFGDPEAQPVLMRLDSDLVDIMLAVTEGRLADQEIRWLDEASVCVVLASGGYPGGYEKGKIIQGLDKIDEAVVFHAGTREVDGKIATGGGRVLGVTAKGSSIQEAINKVYPEVEKISFDGMQYRKDIGQKALKRTSK